jgi:hypothetical protein
VLESQVLWKDLPSFLEKDDTGKMLIFEMLSHRRAVLAPESWKPWINATSISSIKVEPYLTQGLSPCFTPKPYRASIPVAAGVFRGKTLTVGMRFKAAGPVGNNLCIGIVGTGRNLRCQTILIGLAPFTGRCFIEHDQIAMQAQALPLIGVPSAYEGHVWCHVTEEGAIRFLRQFKGGQLEDAGIIPHETLDRCIDRYFPSIQIWLSQLQTDLEVSVDYSGHSFPDRMLVPKADTCAIHGTWAMFEDTLTNMYARAE